MTTCPDSPEDMPPSPAPQGMPFKTLFLFAVALILIWGSAFTMVGVGVRYISPIWLVADRLAVGAILVTAYMIFKGYRFPKITDERWIWYAVLGLTSSVIPFFLLGTGQKTVDSGLSAILVAGMPLMTIVMAHFVTDEKLTILKLLGFVLGLFGIIILFLPDDLSASLVSDWKAQSLIVGAAFFYALTTVLAKIAPETPSTTAAAMMMVSAAFFGIIAAVFTGFTEAVPPTDKTLLTLLMVLGLGVGSSGVATIMYLYVIDVAGTSVMASINYFVPVASVIFGVWLLHEPLTWRIFAAFGIIVLGVMISRIGQKNTLSEPARTDTDC
jgi:drug/metabolite transporter (DMT)-like permease